MAINRREIESLCSAEELATVDATRRSRLRDLSVPQLRSLLSRARRIRDKYADLTRRQKLAKRRLTKRALDPAHSNVRTKKKAALFDQVVDRVQRWLERLEEHAPKDDATAKAVARPGRARSSRSRARASVPGARARRRKAASERSREARAAKHFRKTRAKVIQTHLRAAGKRRQAKRDSR